MHVCVSIEVLESGLLYTMLITSGVDLENRTERWIIAGSTSQSKLHTHTAVGLQIVLQANMCDAEG